MIIQQSVSMMNQYAEEPADDGANMAQSALAHAALQRGENAKTASGVVLVERPVDGLLMLRAADQREALGSALQARCGVGLSQRLQSASQDAYCVRWMGPDCWLLSCPLNETYAIEQALRENTAGHIAIVELSGGYSTLELSGRHALSVMKKSTAYDTDADNFMPGKVVNTTFAKAQVTLRALEPDDNGPAFELIVRRSFSDYVWLWLQNASAEYGLTALHGQSRPAA